MYFLWENYNEKKGFFMKKILHLEHTRGKGEYGWLRANYSFSFAHYVDATRMQFGALRVLNDDFIAPSAGFGMHGHENMEIITIPLQGVLKHKDSLGHEGVLGPGEVQVMSAGMGLQHSEVNGSAHEITNILQLWVLPERRQVVPRYEQRYFEAKEYENRFLTVVTPWDANDGRALWMYQQAYCNIGKFPTGEAVSYTFRDAAHGVYLFVISGMVEVDGERMAKRDAMGIWDTTGILFNVIADAELLVIEVPMNW